ncbi:NfeD family protein [Agrococcus casei]|uniref:Putative activity regulator of membrane protease YbbK n=1 Tax=Agrococcus casei LMG 22410 TaxID=1255656 RepID=A0A1R4FSR7_9MICO|nr:NfeD family protein [Agrococcus casei]SJM58958.1 Putative activity regulator of membrane protease YbbK [Agrococcus casei LMG 22410]
MDVWTWAWVVWLVIALVFLIIEMLTLEFTFLMLGLGSVGGLLSSLTGLPWWAQVIIAGAVACLLLFLVRPVLLKRLHDSSDPVKLNVAGLVGMQGEVTKPFSRGRGRVRLTNGDDWSARLSPNTQPRDPDVGERVVVTAIEGATAVIIPTQR